MKIAVAGMGLIGGSLYKASVAAGYETAGLHRGDSEGLEDADVAFVCMPPSAIVPWIRSRAALFKPGAAVVDICGVKRRIVEEMEAVPKDGWHFVGGHPMAGKEKCGFENSDANLFRGASMVMTPGGSTPPETVETLAGVFRSLGFARTVVSTAEEHDSEIAYTSQLCHVISTAYARDPKLRGADGFSAGSFADMTRIATQQPSTWRELYEANADNLVATLDGFIARLGEFRDALASGDGAAVERMIAEGSAARESIA